jgi:hypothetical protein
MAWYFSDSVKPLLTTISEERALSKGFQYRPRLEFVPVNTLCRLKRKKGSLNFLPVFLKHVLEATVEL